MTEFLIKRATGRRLGAPNPVDSWFPGKSPAPERHSLLEKLRQAGRPVCPDGNCEREKTPRHECPEELRDGRSTCRATCSLSGENDARPARHFAGCDPRWCKGAAEPHILAGRAGNVQAQSPERLLPRRYPAQGPDERREQLRR